MTSVVKYDRQRQSTLETHLQGVQRAIRAMREHVSHDWTLEEIARVAFMSPYHFNRTFGHVTGIPPVRFLSAIRIAEAKTLLLTTRASVTDICFDVGYNSLGTFVDRFSHAVGLPPGRFRAAAHTNARRALSENGNSRLPLNVSRISGRISAPEEFHGTIFVGLFQTPIAQTKTVASTLVEYEGHYQIAPVPDGAFYLLSLGLRDLDDRRELFLNESTLRGGGQRVQFSHGNASTEVNLVLRPCSVFDPPVLLEPTHLLAKTRAFAEGFRSA